MKKFKGKYRIPSARWAAWDYGANAAYFIAICTKTRSHDFGAIVVETQNLASLQQPPPTMALTPLGQSAWDCWEAIPEHFPFVILDEFVVMPNHVHGILIIDKPEGDPAPAPAAAPKNKFGPQSKNLASIVRGYKIGVTKYAREHNIPFQWQPRYHDHVIRNAAEHERIRQYIRDNPKNWKDDSLYTE